MGAVDERLASLGLTVPEVAPPVAAYVPAGARRSRVYVSGQVPDGRRRARSSRPRGEGPGLVPRSGPRSSPRSCALNAIAP